MRKISLKVPFIMLAISFLSAGLAFAAQSRPQGQQAPAQPAPPAPASSDSTSIDQVLDKITKHEAAMAAKMRGLHPIVETYLQNLDKDDALTFHPTADKYFLGKLDLDAVGKEHSMLKKSGIVGNLTGQVTQQITQLYSVKYLPNGFAQMLVVDGIDGNANFNRTNYDFEYVRREFLGEVRTLVFDVTPKKGLHGTFRGRVWAEDQDYNVVRFNGTYGPATATKMYFHFDSWREYVGDGQWLPAYIYSEESDMAYLGGSRHLRFKGQTRLWGYNVGKSNAQNELTALIVESDQIKDRVEDAEGASPVSALRAWERQAEDNVIQRLEKAGLLAPDGEVNKVLETVATNLEVTNNLDILPEVRARVLLTSPLESFTIGHTIVLSRGLVDVLPDEASLAMVIAHELAHISLGHGIDTKYAFNDRMLFEDPQAFQRVRLQRDEREEAEADKKAAEFLKNSPYKDKLGSAGLFLQAVDARARQLDHLLLPHIGNNMIKGGQVQRMADLKQNSPKLELAKTDQIAALPLGGRVRLDPWSARIELVKSKPVAVLLAREKMPFEVSPFMLYLTRRPVGQQPQQQAARPAATTAAAAPPAPDTPGEPTTAVKP